VLSEPVECDVPYLDTLFLKGKFDVCLAKVEGYLDEIKRKSCPRQWTKAEPTYTNETDSLIILAIQCHYEMELPLDKIRSLFTKTYGQERYLPPKVFLVWLQLLIKKGLVEEGYTETVKYLRSHVKIIPSSKYKQLVELLIFHCLVPLKKKTQARMFLTVNRTLDPPVKKAFLKALDKKPELTSTDLTTSKLPSVQETSVKKEPQADIRIEETKRRVEVAKEPKPQSFLMGLLNRFFLLKKINKLVALIGFLCTVWVCRWIQSRLSKVKRLSEYAQLFGLGKSLI